MAQIRSFPVLSRLRSDASSHVLRYRKGRLVQSGRGLVFWFRRPTASIAEVPMDDRETTLFVKGRSQDFQQVSVQGSLTWHVTDPRLLAERVDFSIGLVDGRSLGEPLERIESRLRGVIGQTVLQYLSEAPVRALLDTGIEPLRQRLEAALGAATALSEIGIAAAAVRIASLAPSSELERALQTPTFEALQQKADEATFERRALAVEKERAIGENELATKTELARRETVLIEQEAANARARASGLAEANLVGAEAEAGRIRAVEGAKAEADEAHIAIYRDLPPAVLMGLAARDLASKLTKIEHVNITPDLLANILGDSASRRPSSRSPGDDMAALTPRAVLVTRETDYELLLARHATREQARFFLDTRGQRLADLEAQHDRFVEALRQVRLAVPADWRQTHVKRADLDRFLFAPEDIVVAVGQDGLVANVAKYLDGQLVLRVNTAPDLYDGVLARLRPDRVAALLPASLHADVAIEARTMIEARLDDGERLRALNEIFVGHRSHQSARYEIAVGDETERQSSSGLLVTSGTGATGWARSIMEATHVDLPLDPQEKALAYLVREPFPSVATGTHLRAGRLDGIGFTVTSRMNDGGTIFADGLEQDRLSFDWGRRLSVTTAETAFGSSRAEQRRPERDVSRLSRSSDAPPRGDPASDR